MENPPWTADPGSRLANNGGLRLICTRGYIDLAVRTSAGADWRVLICRTQYPRGPGTHYPPPNLNRLPPSCAASRGGVGGPGLSCYQTRRRIGSCSRGVSLFISLVFVSFHSQFVASSSRRNFHIVVNWGRGLD